MRTGLLHADSNLRTWQDHSCANVLGGFPSPFRQQVRGWQISFVYRAVHGGPFLIALLWEKFYTFCRP